MAKTNGLCLGMVEQEARLKDTSKDRPRPSLLLSYLRGIRNPGYLPEGFRSLFQRDRHTARGHIRRCNVLLAVYAVEGRNSISVCLGTAWHVKGAGDILAH